MAAKRYKTQRHKAGDPPGSAPAPIRRAWQGLAVACVGLGGIGAVLPLVPTTPFLLLAAWAASRSSPELHEWLYQHPRYGPLLRDWRDHRALRPRVKCLALLLIVASWLIMMMTVDSNPVRLLASLVMLTVAVFLATRPAHPGAS
ncbi:YbaN family protein [Halofilum ochraceum]|uniref:YbaN family protein n=1 Tax=Halofilum ochraceum TaxID=1611323 RepID=UPI0011131496|nr:YbaN family protein [Halofilum ochraceum]